jgi:hypothetical protein
MKPLLPEKLRGFKLQQSVTKAIKPTDQNNIALNARQLILATLPHSDPGNIPRWTRKNGNLILSIQPGYKSDPKTGEDVLIGYPYGSIPRLILFWIVTEAKRTLNPRLELGHNLADFMRKLGMNPDSRGPRSGVAYLHKQMEKLLNSRIGFEEYMEPKGRAGRKWLNMEIVTAGHLWWNPRDPDQTTLWGSYIILSDTFFKAVTTSTIPVRMSVLRALKKSPLALDLYAWLTYEADKAQRTKKGRFVPWSCLQQQMGTDYTDKRDFGKKVRAALRKIVAHYPGIKLGNLRGGIDILPDSLPDVSRQDASQIIDSAIPSKTIPSGAAMTIVREQVNTSKGSIAIACEFQEAVKRGEVENTDKAFLEFARRYEVH